MAATAACAFSAACNAVLHRCSMFLMRFSSCSMVSSISRLYRVCAHAWSSWSLTLVRDTRMFAYSVCSPHICSCTRFRRRWSRLRLRLRLRLPLPLPRPPLREAVAAAAELLLSIGWVGREGNIAVEHHGIGWVGRGCCR